jgi:hypothetical protein
VRNCHQNRITDSDRATGGGNNGTGMGGDFDTHSNAIDVEFIDCSSTTTHGWNNSIGVTLRGRKNGVRNYKFRVVRAGGYGTAVELHGGDQWAHGVEMENGWMGVRVMDGYQGGVYDTARIDGGRFRNLWGPAVWVASGHDDVHVMGIKEITDVGKVVSGGVHQRSAIHFGGSSTGHRVVMNYLPYGGATGNLISVDTGNLSTAAIKIEGNVVTGYGVNSIGISSALVGGSATFDGIFGPRNVTD